MAITSRIHAIKFVGELEGDFLKLLRRLSIEQVQLLECLSLLFGPIRVVRLNYQALDLRWFEEAKRRPLYS